MKIIKRNGSEAEFDRQKIVIAIGKANRSVEDQDKILEEEIEKIAEEIEKTCEGGATPSVEAVQDMVEKKLMERQAFELCKHYITYRYTRALARHANTTDDRILSLIDLKNEEAKQENANKNPIINSTQRDYMAGEVSKDISARILLPADVVKAHEEGIIHFHDMDYFAQRMHNCFTGGTKFVTDSGVRQFKEFQDGEAVYVRDKDGVLRIATVRKFGEQKMQTVTLKNGKMERKVKCTADHRWILADGSVTTSLSVGDVLYPLSDNATKDDIKTKEEAFAWCVGFIVGDGCDVSGSANGGTRVRLCGDKAKYASIFEKAGFTRQNLSNTTDPYLYYGRALKQDFINGKVWRFMTTPLKVLAFHGYYAADGAVNAHKITTADERVCRFIEEVSSIAGYYISSQKEEVHSTAFKENARLFSYQFVVDNNAINHRWRVTKIEPDRHGQVPAYCVVEPVTHSFTLEGGIVTGNCDLVNLEDMLQNGTVITGTLIEKPHSFATACNIATQIIAQVASNQYGGQTITLTHLAPFVEVSRQKYRKQVRANFEAVGVDASDEQINKVAEMMLMKEVRSGVQTIQYQINTLLTTNGQAPFVTVYMYLNECKDEATKADLALIIEEVLKQRYEGVKNEKGVWITPAFPKLIYTLEEDNVRPGTKYYYLTELAAKCTAKRMVPDYISEKVMLQLKGDVYPCMGCRSFLTPDRFTDNGTGNIANAGNYQPGVHKYYGRWNQGVVTVNLVDIGLSANGDMDKFWEIFDERMELCHRALRCRHERLLGTVSDVAPILWQYGALARLQKGEKIDKMLYGGYSTLSLGYAGLWECVLSLNGKKLTEPEGEALGLEIMRKLNEYTAKWKAAENIDYSLYGTPLESTTYKFAKCLQRRFGVIPGITDRGYITNSYHIHVTEPISAFEKIEIESRFQALSPGGAISYVEVPNMSNNIEAVLSIMQFMYDHILYAELNTKSDYCQVCGWDGEIEIVEDDGKLVWECPNCHNRDQSKMNVARRTCGYIGTQFWNQGRTQEIKERVLHVSG